VGEEELYERLAANQEPADREHGEEGYADVDHDLLEVHRQTVIDWADVELR
jgi:hypothetical protein